MRVGFLLSPRDFPGSNSGFRLGGKYLSLLSHFASPDLRLRWLLWFGAEAPGHARDLCLTGREESSGGIWGR